MAYHLASVNIQRALLNRECVCCYQTVHHNICFSGKHHWPFVAAIFLELIVYSFSFRLIKTCIQQPEDCKKTNLPGAPPVPCMCSAKLVKSKPLRHSVCLEGLANFSLRLALENWFFEKYFQAFYFGGNLFSSFYNSQLSSEARYRQSG